MSEEFSPIGRSWEEIEKEIFSPEEIAASDLRVAIMCELIDARQKRGITQQQLEHLSGVRQPIIARMETGVTNPQIDTVLKVLASLGKTLYVGDIRQGHAQSQVKVRSRLHQNTMNTPAAAKIPALAGVTAKKSGK